MATGGCSYRFRHPRRPRGRCGLPCAPGAERCYWHTEPKRRSPADCGQQLAELVQGEHWLEGARLDHAELRGLDLSCANLPHADLREASLEGTLLAGACLDAAHLSSAKLNKASLVRAGLRKAELNIADLRGAQLEWADLSGATLVGTKLDGAYLYSVHWSKNTAVDAAEWGTLGEMRDARFARASNAYRNIAAHFESLSNYAVSDEFYFLQTTAMHLEAIGATRVPAGGAASRAVAWLGGLWPPVRLGRTLAWAIHRWVWGYGSRPSWAFTSLVATVLVFAAVFAALGTACGEGPATHGLLEALDVSLVSFATLGYGTRTGVGVLGEFLGGLEALFGAFLTSAFIVALATKYVRR